VIIEPLLQKEIIRGLSDKLKACYIFPDIAEQISVRLQKHLEDGEYADITEGEFFAFALTMHMQEVNHFEVFIPVARAINPVTGKDLEGIGVSPDISVPQEHAFMTAYHMALQAVLTNLSGSYAGPCGVLAKEAQTALSELEANPKKGE
jgi:hypothetical protein